MIFQKTLTLTSSSYLSSFFLIKYVLYFQHMHSNFMCLLWAIIVYMGCQPEPNMDTSKWMKNIHIIYHFHEIDVSQ